jgi:hypothetical protein
MPGRLFAILAWCHMATVATAQPLPSEPITFGGGRGVLSGDLSASIAPEDTGFFNYTDYEHSTLRTLRLGVAASFRVTTRVAVLADVRSENLDRVSPVALYARIEPVPGRRLTLQVGRVPPAFGGASRHTYGTNNPLIGTPLAYQYLTSLRANAVPASATELVAMRGRGWLASYSLGDTTPDRGVPLVSSFTYDTGIQLTAGWRIVEITGAVTTGTLSNPRVSDDNAGKQLVGRVTATPTTGLVLGVSTAQGPFLARRAVDAIGSGEDEAYTQTAQGFDVEYSRGHWMVRGDAVFSAWRIPLQAESRIETLRAAATAVEARYTFMPGAYAAARAERLTFGNIATSGGPIAWDAPVSRVEAGGGYYIQRNVIARVSLQLNRREAGRVSRARLLAAQLHVWF